MPKHRFNECVQFVETALANIAINEGGETLGGTTTVKAHGQWHGQFEDTQIVQTWVTDEHLELVLTHAHQIAKTLKGFTWQDAVAVTYQPFGIEFV